MTAADHLAATGLLQSLSLSVRTPIRTAVGQQMHGGHITLVAQRRRNLPLPLPLPLPLQHLSATLLNSKRSELLEPDLIGAEAIKRFNSAIHWFKQLTF